MNHSHENHVHDARDVKLGIIAPDGRDGMLQHAREFHDAGIPFVFDPGQGMPMFSGPELLEFVRMASYVAVNDYEAQMLQERTGTKLEELAQMVKALVVTLGAQGSHIYANGARLEIPCVKPEARGGSHRLRRRLPRRAALRHRRRARLECHRAPRVAAGRDQDRPARRAEPSIHARRDRAALPGELRRAAVVSNVVT